MNDITIGENGYLLPPAKLPFSLSFVIPAFNEEGNITEVVERSVKISELICEDYEIIVVNDLSTDSTGEILKELQAIHPRLKVIHNDPRLGCHPSECKALLQARCDYAFFIPADLQIVPEEILKFVPHMTKGDITFGYRVGRADTWARRTLSSTYNLINRIVFAIPVKDIDSVAVFSRAAMRQVIPQLRPESAFSNIEMVLIAQQEGLVVQEIDICHFPRLRGKAKGVNLRDLIYVPINFIKLFIAVYLLRKRSPSQAAR